jgi:hypothetical protein
MPATTHLSSAAKTRCRIVATTVNCTVHLIALINSEVPTPIFNTPDIKTSNKMKVSAIATFTHPNCVSTGGSKNCASEVAEIEKAVDARLCLACMLSIEYKTGLIGKGVY